MIDLTDLTIYVGCIVEYEVHEYNDNHCIPKKTRKSIIVDADKYYVYVINPGGVKQLARGDIMYIKAPLTESELLIRRL